MQPGITGDRVACPREMQSRDLATSRDHGRSHGLPSGERPTGPPTGGGRCSRAVRCACGVCVAACSTSASSVRGRGQPLAWAWRRDPTHYWGLSYRHQSYLLLEQKSSWFPQKSRSRASQHRLRSRLAVASPLVASPLVAARRVAAPLARVQRSTRAAPARLVHRWRSTSERLQHATPCTTT